MIVTTNDIQAAIAIIVRNNKSGVIAAMNTTGHPVPTNIPGADLVVEVWKVFKAEGIQGLQNVLSKVPVDPTRITQEEARALAITFQGADPNAKFGDWIKGIGTYFGDLLGGSSVSGGSISQMMSESVLSPAMIGFVVVIGVILMAVFRKTVILVIAILVIMLAVIMYGIFAKKITSITQGGTTVTHGGIGSVILSWLTGKP